MNASPVDHNIKPKPYMTLIQFFQNILSLILGMATIHPGTKRSIEPTTAIFKEQTTHNLPQNVIPLATQPASTKPSQGSVLPQPLPPHAYNSPDNMPYHQTKHPPLNSYPPNATFGSSSTFPSSFAPSILHGQPTSLNLARLQLRSPSHPPPFSIPILPVLFLG